MKKTEKRLFAFSIAAAMLFVMPSSASAMHIMEGYLPMGHAIAWGALCLPFLVAGFISIKKTISPHRKALLILAMAGAYAFVLSALKIPSVTGSSSHPTGTGLGAILFGPSAMSGIGMMIQQANGYYQMDVMLMGIILLGIIGICFEKIVKFLERRFTGWQETIQQ